MADKITLASVATFQNDTSAVAAINNNNALITTAFDNTLSRDGTTPNQMLNNLDMNNNQILNLPAPATVNSPARLIDVVSNPTITVPSVGTSGANVGLLNANKTDSGNNTFSGTETFSNTVTFSVAPVLPSASIPTAAIQNNAVTNALIRQGVAKSVIGVTGNATANVADIAGTTRQVLAVNTAGTALAFAQPQGDQLLATTTNDSASAGNVGEFLSSSVSSGSAVALTTATPANMTSLSLTAGDWDVNASFYFTGNASTVNYLTGSISLSSATLDISNLGRYATTTANGAAVFNATNTPNSIQVISIPPTRISIASTTTVFAVVQCSFATTTCNAYGIIQARRAR